MTNFMTNFTVIADSSFCGSFDSQEEAEKFAIEIKDDFNNVIIQEITKGVKTMKIKTVDINAREWFDKRNGNSYFSCNVTINYGMKTEKSFYMPMQYGYDDHYRDMAFKELQRRNYIPAQKSNISYWRYFQENKIIARYSKIKSLLRDL